MRILEWLRDRWLSNAWITIYDLDDRVDCLENKLIEIGNRIMLDIITLTSDVDTLQTAVAGVSTTLGTLVSEVADLKNQVANGSGVTQEQLDALDAKIKGGIDTLVAAKAAGDAA